MTITKARQRGLLNLLMGIFIGYLGLSSLLLIEDTHLTIDRIIFLLGLGMIMTFYGIWTIYSNKPKESKKEVIVLVVLSAILAILTKFGIN